MDSTADSNFLLLRETTLNPYDNTSQVLGSAYQEPMLNLVDILNIYLIPVIILVGVAGNSSAFVVLMVTPRLFCQSSNMYLAFLAMVDNLSLVFVMTVWFGWVGINFFHKNGWCQVINYFASVCSFLSAWTVIGFTCERWVTIFHPLKRHIICTKRKALIIMTCLTIGSMTFYSFTLFIYKVKTFPNGREVCLMVYKFLILSKIAFSFDTLLNVVMPLVIIITMNFGMALKIWLYARRNSKIQCLLRSQTSSAKRKESPGKGLAGKSCDSNAMRDGLSECDHLECLARGHASMNCHIHRRLHSKTSNVQRCPKRSVTRKGYSLGKGSHFQSQSKMITADKYDGCRSARSENCKPFHVGYQTWSLDRMCVNHLRRNHIGTSSLAQGSESVAKGEFGQNGRQTQPPKLISSRLTSDNSFNVGNTNLQQNQSCRGENATSWKVLTKKHHTQVRITRTLLSISTFFILFNLPSYVFRIYSFFDSAKKHQNVTSLIVQFLHFSNFSSRFFLYTACSRNFRYAINRFTCQRNERHKNERRAHRTVRRVQVESNVNSR